MSEADGWPALVPPGLSVWMLLLRSFLYRGHGGACVDTPGWCAGLATGLCLPGAGREGEGA